MQLNEAIADPKRPLSISPMEWMMSVEASLAEDEELTGKVARRIAASERGDGEKTKGNKDYMLSGIETVDMGIDQMVQGAKLVCSGLEDSKKADMLPPMRKAVEEIRELMETAIIPYLGDIVELSDRFEDEEE